jgi:hypothetical protein
MSAPTEAQGRPYWHETLGDLQLWYPTFEVFAASAPQHNEFFHGAHVGSPVDLERVVATLGLLEKTYGSSLTANPLPTLEQLRAELGKRRQAGVAAGTTDNGSPCHNFWHWLHGDS